MIFSPISVLGLNRLSSIEQHYNMNITYTNTSTWSWCNVTLKDELIGKINSSFRFPPETQVPNNIGKHQSSQLWGNRHLEQSVYVRFTLMRSVLLVEMPCRLDLAGLRCIWMSCETGLDVVLTVLYDSDIHRRGARHDIRLIHAALGLDLKVQSTMSTISFYSFQDLFTATEQEQDLTSAFPI